MSISPTTLRRQISSRVRIACIAVYLVGSLFPPYIPKAALAPEGVDRAFQQYLLVEDGFIMKSSPLTDRTARRTYAEGRIHTVKPGESYERLANRYAIAIDTIRWANGLRESDVIQPGDELLILPVDGVIHTVSRGQTLSRIAQLYDIDQRTIMDQNKLESSIILTNQELIIPGARPIVGKKAHIATVDGPPVEPKADVVPIERPADPVTPKPIPPIVAGITRDKKQTFTDSPTGGVLQKPCSSACFYTQRYHGSHFGIDLQERGGGPIYASEDGVVRRAQYGWNGGYGHVIEVDHGNNLVTLYAHNKELYVEKGDYVQRGQMIAWMGNTGRVYGPTGIHLHFEVRLHGVKKNPTLYIE